MSTNAALAPAPSTTVTAFASAAAPVQRAAERGRHARASEGCVPEIRVIACGGADAYFPRHVRAERLVWKSERGRWNVQGIGFALTRREHTTAIIAGILLAAVALAAAAL